MRILNGIKRYGLDVIKWICFFLLYMVVQFFWGGTLQQNQFARLSNFVIYILVALFVVGFLLWRYQTELDKNNPRGFGRQRLTKQRFWFMVAMVVCLGIIQAVNIWLTIRHQLPVASNQTSVNQTIVANPISSDIMVILVAPPVEELLFRGFFFNYLFTKPTRFNNIVGVLMSGFLFGWAHEQAFTMNLLVYMLFGCVLAYTYLHTRDIRYDIGLHFLNNFLSTFL
ncbi:metal-dependent membrane protease [Lactobacillus selangorensis]|uniref:Metal-dependent membrane protease n=1 Tax=Lactobacillus selangorensis TaxID=81857 RepID=A0A0R2FSJ0_9LACO|nr:type II CAAX endopeptidase family protein [Lactobacillus selangorensis]KRN27942.1 metal-dependent membrane protease [Lactobacillus selangorensis]KRN30587.1 metal-dependent membrane protease [Lactobacillus selangorensis]